MDREAQWAAVHGFAKSLDRTEHLNWTDKQYIMTWEKPLDEFCLCFTFWAGDRVYATLTPYHIGHLLISVVVKLNPSLTRLELKQILPIPLPWQRSWWGLQQRFLQKYLLALCLSPYTWITLKVKVTALVA